MSNKKDLEDLRQFVAYSAMCFRLAKKDHKKANTPRTLDVMFNRESSYMSTKCCLKAAEADLSRYKYNLRIDLAKKILKEDYDLHKW